MKFIIEIACDNAAFVTEDGEPDPGPEITRILGWVVNDIGNGAIRPDVVKALHAKNLPEGDLLRDINGNTVGSWKLVKDD